MLFSLPWYFYALVAAAFLGVVKILEKKELKKEHSLEYVVLLAVVNLIVASFLWPWVDFGSISKMAIVWIYLTTAVGTLAIWLTAKALRHLDVSVVAPQTVLGVVFAMLIAALFLGERISGMQLVGAVIILVGSYLINRQAVAFHVFGPHHRLRYLPKSPPLSTYVVHFQLILVLAMFFLGLSSVLDKFVLTQIAPVTFIFLAHIFLFINHLVLYWIIQGNFSQLKKGFAEAGWLIVGISLLLVFARLVYAQALSLSEVSLVMPLSRLSIPVATLLGGAIFLERGVWFKTLMALAMVLGVWLMVA